MKQEKQIDLMVLHNMSFFPHCSQLLFGISSKLVLSHKGVFVAFTIDRLIVFPKWLKTVKPLFPNLFLGVKTTRHGYFV